MSRRLVVAIALGALVALVVGGWASASGGAGSQDRSVGRAEAAGLATKAIGDDQALAELRAVRSVDGRRVDLVAATAHLGADRRARLQALAGEFGGGAEGDRSAPDARGLAKQVLDDQKYHERRAPQPFKGVLQWLGDRVRPLGKVFAPVGRFIASIPGGGYLFLLLLGAGVGALVWFLANQRSRSVVRGAGARLLVDPEQDPTQLDDLADAAAAAGSFSEAVRLRYEAGLIRLFRSDRIDLRPDTTPGSVAAQLEDPTLSALTVAFEEIVYGGRAGTSDEADEAREGWLRLLGAGTRAGRRT